MNTENPLVSIIIVTYNNKDDIEECLDSILNQTYKNFEIIVVDNASKDGTPDIVQRKYPTVRLIRSPKNLGYAGGNALGLKYAKGDYIVILNPDTIVDKNWLQELVSIANRDNKIGIVGACILLYDQPSRINALGNVLHFTGLVFCNAFCEPYDKYREKDQYLALPSGAAFLIKREVIEEVGFMDKFFFMEFSDTDFVVRALSKGWDSLVTPKAKAYHKYRLKMNPLRLYILERGRYYFLLRNFEIKTLLILLPGLLISEFLIFGFATARGKEYLISKLLAVRSILKRLHRLISRKTANKNFKKTVDKDILRKYASYAISVPREWIKGNLQRKLVELLFNKLYYIVYQISLRLL